MLLAWQRCVVEKAADREPKRNGDDRMDEKKQISLSVRYIDEKLYNKVEEIVKRKNSHLKTKKDILNYVLRDYVRIHELDEFNNPYLIDYIRQIIDSECASLERSLGGRLAKLATENAIQIGILNRVILNYVADPDEHLPLRLREFREASVEDLRNGYKPLSFGDLVKKDEE